MHDLPVFPRLPAACLVFRAIFRAAFVIFRGFFSIPPFWCFSACQAIFSLYKALDMGPMLLGNGQRMQMQLQLQQRFGEYANQPSAAQLQLQQQKAETRNALCVASPVGECGPQNPPTNPLSTSLFDERRAHN